MQPTSPREQPDGAVASEPGKSQIALFIESRAFRRSTQRRRPGEIKQYLYKWFFLLATIASTTAFVMRASFEDLTLFDLVLLPILIFGFATMMVVSWLAPRHMDSMEHGVFRLLEIYFLARIIYGFFFLEAGTQRGVALNDIMPWLGVFILFAFWVFERRRALYEVGVFVGLGMLLSMVFFLTTKEVQPSNYRLIVQQMLLANIAYAWLAYLFSWMTEAYTHENARASMMQRMALTDPLTGIANRRQMELLLDELTEEQERESFGLLLVDLDYFKQVNDNYGHQVGDQVLVAAAQAMKQSLRETEALGRWGGEEFLILLPGIEALEAVNIAERLRSAIAEERVAGGPSITASIGVIDSQQAAGRHALLEHVDEALYQAKARGRNCVVAWEKSEDLPSL